MRIPLATTPHIHATDGVQDNQTCAECGGMCCQSAAGIAYPEDFGPVATLTETLAAYLQTGFWAVDWWEGDPRPRYIQKRLTKRKRVDVAYYIRPAHTNAIGKLLDPSFGGICRLWTPEYGCSLLFENRPKTCRVLIPKKTKRGDCTFSGKVGTKQHAAQAWVPFQKHIMAAIKVVQQGVV